MKKLIIVFAAVAITAGGYAQPDTSKMNQQKMNHNQNMQSNPHEPDKNQNQNMQSNPLDQNNNQKPDMQGNPQDLNRNQKQNMQSNPQDLNNNPNQNAQKHPVDKSHPDGIMMQNGKLVRVKNGQITIFQDNEVTLSNGTKVMKDGTYIKKDGTKLTLKEGQHLDMSGNLIPMKTDKDKNMYLVPDSTRNK